MGYHLPSEGPTPNESGDHWLVIWDGFDIPFTLGMRVTQNAWRQRNRVLRARSRSHSLYSKNACIIN
eukprot:934046-Prymnesium_polylepis.1